MQREAVPATRRKGRTTANAQAVLDAYLGQCAEPACAVPLTLATAEIDHIIPLFQGGREEFANYQPLCVACHKVKTAHDAKANAKLRRQIAKANGEVTRAKRPIRSRPFPADLRKRMNGTVERRA